MLRIPRMQRVQEAYDTLESEGSRSEIFKRVMGDVTADIKLVNAEFSQACQCRASAVPCRTSASAVPCLWRYIPVASHLRGRGARSFSEACSSHSCALPGRTCARIGVQLKQSLASLDGLVKLLELQVARSTMRRVGVVWRRLVFWYSGCPTGSDAMAHRQFSSLRSVAGARQTTSRRPREPRVCVVRREAAMVPGDRQCGRPVGLDSRRARAPRPVAARVDRVVRRSHQTRRLASVEPICDAYGRRPSAVACIRIGAGGARAWCSSHCIGFGRAGRARPDRKATSTGRRRLATV